MQTPVSKIPEHGTLHEVLSCTPTAVEMRNDVQVPADSEKAKRMRKRELDRRNQKVARERTKNRIAHLEQVIDDLNKRDERSRTTALVSHLSAVAADRDHLTKTLRAIRTLVQNHNTTLDDEDSSHDGVVRTEQIIPDEVALITPPRTLHASHHKSICLPASSTSFWSYINTVLVRPTPGLDEQNSFEKHIAQDVPVRALIEGWNAVIQKFDRRLSASWQRIMHVDNVLREMCGMKERLAIMHLMHTLMRYHSTQAHADKELVPAWYLDRPSQRLPHAYAINFLIW